MSHASCVSEPPEDGMSLAAALPDAGVEHPEDIAGLQRSELEDLLQPQLFADADLDAALADAKARLARTHVRPRDRVRLHPDHARSLSVRLPPQPTSWLDRASKARRLLPKPVLSNAESVQQDKDKAIRAAKRLLAVVDLVVPGTSERKQQLVDSLARVHGPSSMGNATRAWTRMRSFMINQTQENAAAPEIPSAVLVKQCLVKHEHRGPTVPQNLLKGLVFCRDHLGVPLLLDDCILDPFRGKPKAHEEIQREVLSLSAWKHLRNIAAGPIDKTVVIATRSILRMLVSSLRMAHAVRAGLRRGNCTDRMQVWRISKGKDGLPFLIATPTHMGP